MAKDDKLTAKNDFPVELMNLTGTHFLDLNDDCLREILTLVTVMDLCSLLELAETTKNIRLKDITNEIFRRKYGTCKLNAEVVSIDEAQRLLTNFGPLISNLTASYSGEDSTRTVKLIKQFCSETLKSLRLENFHFDDMETNVVFHCLETLKLNDCLFQGEFVGLFAHCKSLIKLLVDDTPANEALLQHTYPELEMFGVQWDGERCKSFITRHKKLKAISISISNHFEILPVIADNCSKLEKLWIYSDYNGGPIDDEIAVKSISSLKYLEDVRLSANPNVLSFLRELSHLQSLTILLLDFICFNHDILSALTELKFLERLCIYGCKEFTNLESITKLRRLKLLEIISLENIEFDLVHIVSRLTDLERLYLKFRMDFTIDEIMYSRIMNTRSKANIAHRTLLIECDKVSTTFPRNAKLI